MSPTSVSCPIEHKKSTATTTAIIMQPNRFASVLRNMRGGNDIYNRESGDSRNDRNRLKSTRLLNIQRPLSLERFWKLGTKKFEYLMQRAMSKTSEAGIGKWFGTVAKQITIKKSSRENIVASNIRQKNSLNDVTGDDHIELRKNVNSQRSISTSKQYPYSPFRMYCSCMGIVSLWILTGTLFYSYINEWPIPQSFFYAVDAGMSIGFCTDVAETKLVSKAFTIIFILLGASVVGGALALFIQDIVEGVVERERTNNGIILTKEYELMIGKEAFEQFDISHTGMLTKDEFRKVLKFICNSTSGRSSTPQLSEEDIDVLWTKFDRIKDGAIRFEEFEGSYRGIEGLVESLHNSKSINTGRKSFENQDEEQSIAKALKWISSLATSSVSSFARPLLQVENRIFVVFLAWVFLGITWGILDQGWDPITATHFAISALATGGLTGPSVNSNGILPAQPSIFCGCYCLFGIPLMAITFGHFARVLVSDHVAAMEKWALTRPMTATDYEIAKQYLLKMTGTKVDSRSMKSIRKRRRQQGLSLSPSTAWQGLRLSDFIVLQLLRQGRISVETINILRKEFELLDMDKTGTLTLEEATNW